jgi:predicted nucleic acid-binding protein
VIFDTDIFIYIQRGNVKAAALLDRTSEKYLSVQSYMELMQGARNKQEQDQTKLFLRNYNCKVLPLTENIGHRASVYIDAYALSGGLHSTDALIAATAAEQNLMLCSSNYKHYKCIPDLKFKVFKP